MTLKMKEYVKGTLIVILLSILIIGLDLPKFSFATLALSIPFVVIFHEIWPGEKYVSRKKSYSTAILFFLLFGTIIYLFEFPGKLFLFIGIMSISFIVLDEVFRLIPNRERSSS